MQEPDQRSDLSRRLALPDKALQGEAVRVTDSNKGGEKLTIYRDGQHLDSDTLFWFTFTQEAMAFINLRHAKARFRQYSTSPRRTYRCRLSPPMEADR